MTKTLIDIPDELLADAMRLLRVTTKADAVRTALAEAVRRRETEAFRIARQVKDDLVAARARPIGWGGISDERAEELIADIRRHRDERQDYLDSL
ncbi:MAG: type II toxin-antitoxin system VapB family antitoxin [Nocardioides sp.]|uniref:type II toxin-antitoxin system VapB family antitoxin n=1 Tax=Nocardioides sp. TaxID=35761 RepID=UPI0039E497E0